jgi:hypothetical protein
VNMMYARGFFESKSVPTQCLLHKGLSLNV